MPPEAFARYALVSLMVFVAAVLGYPWLLDRIGDVTECAWVNGVCDTPVLAALLKIPPPFFYILVGSLAGPCMRRARDLGVPGWSGLFVPLMALADHAMGTMPGRFWWHAFAGDVGFFRAPRFLIFALICLAILSIAPSGSLRPGGLRGVRLAALAAAVVLAVFAAEMFRTALGFTPLWSDLANPVAAVSVFVAIRLLAPVLMALFVLLIGLLVWTGRHAPPWNATEAVRGDRPAGAETNVALAVCIAALLTVIAIGLRVRADGYLSSEQWYVVLPTLFQPLFVPTFLLYLAPVLALARLWAGRNRWSAGLVLLSLLPFALWVTACVRTYQARTREAATVAAIATVAMDRVPDTLVFDDETVSCARLRDRVPGLTAVIQRSPGPRYDREDCAATYPARTKVDELPGEYLLLAKFDACPSATTRSMSDPWRSPLELRLISVGRDDLVAVLCEARTAWPAVPPVLRHWEWLRPEPPPRISRTQRRSDFVADALARSEAREK